MQHLLQKSKCLIFHIIFKYMIFQGVKRRYGVKGYDIMTSRKKTLSKSKRKYLLDWPD